MFEFFEGLIGDLKLKLVSNFSDKLSEFISETFKNIGKDKDDKVKEVEASSGYYSQLASSGNYSKLASSGGSSQLEVTGNSSIAFACGYKSIIKAKKGTWIALAEYGEDKEGRYIPIFAVAVQIGNKEFKDVKGKILKETEFYTLHDKKLYAVDSSDGILTLKISERTADGIKIIKGLGFNNFEEIYVVKEGELSAHGDTLREALDDLTFKKLKNTDVSDIVAEIKKSGKVNRMQYRVITGACRRGTNNFCKQHNIEDLEEIELDELKKILVNDYGAEKFWSLIDKN